MTHLRALVVLCGAAVVVTACASQTQTLANKQGAAMEAALQRGRFDLNCPSATATVLSSDYLQPAVQGPWVRGLQRAEYTVGVEGCNQRTTFGRPLSGRHGHLLRGEPQGPVPSALGNCLCLVGATRITACDRLVLAFQRDFGSGKAVDLQMRGALLALGFTF